jgi:UDP-N-acetylmuramate dehydrogenase
MMDLPVAKPMEFQALQGLQAAFGERVQRDLPLARYTAARLGGPADVFLELRSSDELVQAASLLWQVGETFTILGGGSNVLVSDAGVRGVVLLNRARRVSFDQNADLPSVWAESGANFGRLARQAAQKGLSGLEWAAGIPGTLGGAVVGNAGAHGGDMAGSLLLAEILHHEGQMEIHRETWPVTDLQYTYRSSRLKRQPGEAVVLGARLRLAHAHPEQVQARIDELVAARRRTQPPGASMGSMFKNPPGDYAGRLIDAAGLKGTRRGQAEISRLHGNFFLNLGGAQAQDVYGLIRLAQDRVQARFGVHLELEIELVGDWGALQENADKGGQKPPVGGHKPPVHPTEIG